MDKKIIGVIGFVVLIGLVMFVSAIQKSMEMPGTTLSGEFQEVRVDLFADSWNLIYGFPNPEWISGGEVIPEQIKAIYALYPGTNEYVRFYPNPDLEKIKDSNFRWDTYMGIGAFFVLTDYSGGNTGEMKYWALESPQLNNIQLLSGWNFIGVTSNFKGKSINQIKGNCDIQKVYTFQNNKWVDLKESMDESSLLFAYSGTQNIGLVIKVVENCNFGTSSSSGTTPPGLPSGETNCDNLGNEFGDKDFCYTKIAKDSKDDSICTNSIEEESWRIICYSLARDDIEECDKLDGNNKVLCYSYYGEFNNDPSVCEGIIEENYRDNCYGNVAMSLKDSSICNNIKKDALRESCPTWIEE